ASSVLAFDGQFTNKQNSSTGFRQNLKKRMGGLMNGGGGLVPEEMREQFREDCENLSDEERAQLREERQGQRQTHRQEMEEFVGLSREEMRETHQNGETMGEVLEQQGTTEEDAQSFVAERLNERADAIVERHKLDETDEATLRERAVEVVNNILDRWFR
ncbi:MAG: hypothetical protein U9O78_04065, partial [Patescibacteria group bacterium]|nr:hypothetical protein [Patescibacteria group bacterium]